MPSYMEVFIVASVASEQGDIFRSGGCLILVTDVAVDISAIDDAVIGFSWFCGTSRQDRRKVRV